MVTWKNVGLLVVREPFRSLFPVDQGLVDGMVEEMRVGRGYDGRYPIVVWAGRDVVVDGKLRYEAAKMAGLSCVAVEEVGFGDEKEAVLYCLRVNAGRRQMGEVDMKDVLARVVRVLVGKKGKLGTLERPTEMVGRIAGGMGMCRGVVYTSRDGPVGCWAGLAVETEIDFPGTVGFLK